MMTSRKEDKQAHHMAKQQVATVASSRECVDEQSLRGSNLDTLVTPAKQENVRRRSNSPQCVSWTSTSGVSGKKTRNNTQESVRSKKVDRPRALVMMMMIDDLSLRYH